jgi:signal transduction histidine kinase
MTSAMQSTAMSLRELRPRIVETAAAQLARGEGLRAPAVEQIDRFFSLLEDALESGSPQWLEPCLQEWLKARSSPAFGEQLTLLPVLDQLKVVAWDRVRAGCTPEVALDLILAMEPVFVHGQTFIRSHEIDAIVREAEGRILETGEKFRRLEKSKSDFIAVAAHELKTPLTLIEGYADMLNDAVAASGRPASTNLVGGISKGLARLREIVDDLVDASMIDNQMLSLSFQPVRLRKVVARVYDEMALTLTERHITAAMPEFENSDVVTADPQRMLQVFRQLIFNAIKYTPDGGRISVSAHPRPGFIEVLVSDTGIGIAQEHQQRLFERFAPVNDVALHSTSKTRFKGGGTGLGLAIVKGIIEAHGGSVWCESPGYDETTYPGSTFHLMIPLMPPNPEAARAARSLQTEVD